MEPVRLIIHIGLIIKSEASKFVFVLVWLFEMLVLSTITTTHLAPTITILFCFFCRLAVTDWLSPHHRGGDLFTYVIPKLIEPDNMSGHRDHTHTLIHIHTAVQMVKWYITIIITPLSGREFSNLINFFAVIVVFVIIVVMVVVVLILIVNINIYVKIGHRLQVLLVRLRRSIIACLFAASLSRYSFSLSVSPCLFTSITFVYSVPFLCHYVPYTMACALFFFVSVCLDGCL